MLKYRLYNEFFSELIVQLKIIIATFQIISSSSNTLSVNYPHLFQSFTEIIQVWLHHLRNHHHNHYLTSKLSFLIRHLMSTWFQFSHSSVPFIIGISIDKYIIILIITIIIILIITITIIIIIINFVLLSTSITFFKFFLCLF